jgi:hypothetical protein
MRRRDVLTGGTAFALVATSGAQGMAQSDWEERLNQWRAEALAKFPFERITVTGDQALAEWERLRKTRSEFPVVIGSDEDVAQIMQAFDTQHMPPQYRPKSAAETIEAAKQIHFPADLVARRQKEGADAHRVIAELLQKNPNAPLPTFVDIDSNGQRQVLDRAETEARLLAEPRDPPLGDWPASVDASPGLSVAYAVLTGKPLDKVHIALIPTGDWTTVPAHLHWGDWNANPPPEFHVAALRSWRNRYAAELIGMSHDVLNLRVARRPTSRDEALALAREQYVYCNDIVDQGMQTLSALAAGLMNDDWWYFWWD